MVFITALLLVCTGGMATFTISGSVDTMSSDAAMSLNSTASTFTVLPVVLIVIAGVALIAVVSLGRRAF